MKRPQPVGLRQNAHVSVTAKAFSGPLPSPEALAAFDQIQAGFADRIVAMAEREQGHRHKLAAAETEGKIDITRRGQTLAAVLAMAIIVGAVILALLGHEKVAIAFLAIDVVGLVSAFVWGRQRREDGTPARKQAGQEAPGEAVVPTQRGESPSGE